MLRITERKEGKNTLVLQLEGKICQEWVKELEVQIIRGLDEGRKMVLDFSKVGFIDDDAAEMIKRFPHKKVERRNGSLFIRTVLGIERRGTE